MLNNSENLPENEGKQDPASKSKSIEADETEWNIKLYGTLDNFNTEYTEWLHIDLAKDAYAATNHKDEFTQMTVWLEQKEKILQHCQLVMCRPGSAFKILGLSNFKPKP